MQANVARQNLVAEPNADDPLRLRGVIDKQEVYGVFFYLFLTPTHCVFSSLSTIFSLATDRPRTTVPLQVNYRMPPNLTERVEADLGPCAVQSSGIGNLAATLPGFGKFIPPAIDLSCMEKISACSKNVARHHRMSDNELVRTKMSSFYTIIGAALLGYEEITIALLSSDEVETDPYNHTTYRTRTHTNSAALEEWLNSSNYICRIRRNAHADTSQTCSYELVVRLV